MTWRSMGRTVVRSFVVRTYRALPDKPDLLLGKAEEVGKRGEELQETGGVVGDSEPSHQKETLGGRKKGNAG